MPRDLFGDVQQPAVRAGSRIPITVTQSLAPPWPGRRQDDGSVTVTVMFGLS
jgi:hypothetical protein